MDVSLIVAERQVLIVARQAAQFSLPDIAALPEGMGRTEIECTVQEASRGTHGGCPRLLIDLASR